jgi:hypothetical protein
VVGYYSNGSSRSGMRGMDWIDLVQDKDTWRDFVHALMNLWFPYYAGNFLTSYLGRILSIELDK